LEWRLLYEFGC